MFMKTTIVPFIKNKTRDTSEKKKIKKLKANWAGYSSSIFLKLYPSIILKDYLVTHDQ